ncbi:MAG TPA: GDP-mannose 4,6-dehydratase [Nevskiaceae bacterium]|nr:GDP-mannose 4,6-dehydratase [Nevskiaceae bacterium]
MRALICGVSGQDGAYLSRLLLDKGYTVYGSSRDASSASLTNLYRLGIRDRVQVESMSVMDFRSVLQVLQKVRPDEVYNLAGQSSVSLSFEQPVETFESISVGTLNLLEAIRFSNNAIRFYNAGSGECYGDTAGMAADEDTLFRPASPYAVAKSAAHWAVATYRQAYKLYACSGVLFNHESPLRPRRFVTRKIVDAACRIAAGEKLRLRLGNTQIVRDWGWAPEYVEAMWLLLQQPQPQDFLIATGASHSLEEFVQLAFAEVGLDWRQHVDSDPSLLRPSDHLRAYANPAKAQRLLGWQARYRMPDVVRMMVAAERDSAMPAGAAG